MIGTIFDGPYLVTHEQGVVTLTFNRPEVRNAIPREVVQPLADLFSQIAADPDARVVLVNAKGDNFGGGGDLAGMRKSLDLPSGERGASYYRRLDVAKAMVRNWCAIPQPVVTACRGSVAGAAMMYTLGADFVVGDMSTYFVCSHVHIGLSPDSGLSWLLRHAIGRQRAADMLMSGRKVEAEEARSIGLLSRIVEADEVDATSKMLARALASGPQKVLRDIKMMIAAASTNLLDAQLDLERDVVAENAANHDFEEGVRAFMEKRRPVFGATE